MNNKNLLLLWMMAAFIFPTDLFAQVLWYGDPDQGVRDVFRRLDPDGNRPPVAPGRCVDDPNNPPEVSTPTDPTYGKHWRIRKPVSRKRAEFARTNGFIPREGDDIYIGWRWKMTSSPALRDGIAVFQWKTDDGGDISRNKQNYPFNMGYDGTTLTISAYGPGNPDWREGSSITNRKTTIWERNVSPGQWVALVFRVKVSKNPDVGFIEFWFNGSKQTLKNAGFKEYQVKLGGDKKRAYHKTNDGKEVYMKWGAYNENACDYDITVNFDDMRVATTYDDARPRGGSSGPSNPPSLADTYFFRNVATGTYMDSDGSSVKVGPNNGATDRQWRLVATSNGYYNIDSQFSGRGVLDSDGNKVVKGSDIQPVSTNDDKEWLAESLGNNVYRFKNRFSGRGYLAANTSTDKIEWTSWDGPRAQWVLEPVGNTRMERISKSNSDWLGLDEEEIAGLENVYPNPVTSHFTVDIGAMESARILIFSLNGQLIHNATVSQSRTQVKRGDKFTSGTYILKVLGDDNTSFIRKIIVQ
ncbi:MAG: heparin lyase I family protein [Bacteroidota bacterium]